MLMKILPAAFQFPIDFAGWSETEAMDCRLTSSPYSFFLPQVTLFPFLHDFLAEDTEPSSSKGIPLRHSRSKTNYACWNYTPQFAIALLEF